ncbi:Probable alpha,alpha-trehalose-phosphate synthase [UDP-forming] 7 [Linum perenne]
MTSRSYANLLDLAKGNFQNINPERKGLPRVKSVPDKFSDIEEDEPSSSDNPSTISADRVIIVSNQLPVKATRNPDDKGWSFTWNEDSLILQLKDGFPEEMEVFYVGSLSIEVDSKDQDEVSQVLLDRFKCVPTFLPREIYTKFYDGFCKKQLWPLFHYMLPSVEEGSRFDRSLWEAYVAANRLFLQNVVEILNPDDDFIWIHDYHLMLLPTYLRRRFNRIRIGFFLHSPFPSSEIYRTLPVREEILKALLNTDLIGFHTFDYARHFLSCCCRMLGLEYQSKRGYLALEYYGRTIGIKIMPVGVHMGRILSVMKQTDEGSWIADLKKRYEGKTVLLGVDDMDIFKGINLKLLAMEQMLKQHPTWQGKAVLVQILNPARGKGNDSEDIRAELQESCRRINDMFGSPGYEPVVIVDKPVSVGERVAYHSIAECVVVTAVRDGMNLTPYEYVVCRQGSDTCTNFCGSKKSMLVISEFIGCSPSMSGAIRVNPWNVEATGEAMNQAISTFESEQQLRHEKHYRYISTHDVAYWSRSFLHDLKRSCADHNRKMCWGIGFGFGFRVMALDPNFRKLSSAIIVSAYKMAKSRAILLDYDGTVMPQNTINKSPSPEVISILNRLCEDPNNTVFIVSGRGRDSLTEWFSPCTKLGIAAEHGYFLRWTHDEGWQNCVQSSEFGWMEIARPVMNLYTESTDGSSIETKESALVWQYRDSDPRFGSAQAKELLDHLESVLANEPVAVKSGQCIVEVKPQEVSKGVVAEKIFTSLSEKGKKADFVLCIGDDRSDEDMFEAIGNAIARGVLEPNASVFACTVEQKPSKAKYYLDDIAEVISTLESLADVSNLQ